MDRLKQKVNIMRLLFILPITILMLFSAQVSADKLLKGTPLSRGGSTSEEKKWYHPFEIGELKIKQTNDGSGIIKEVTCYDCDYQFVKITADTEVFVNGMKVNLLRARERAGQDAFIEFDRETAEVKYIRWAE
jgi:hypothetical protein